MRFSFAGKDYAVPAGVAHYLEHKMFDLPEGNAMEQYAEYGGGNNAFTNYTMTAYYVECTDCFEENLKILLRMVTTPYFTDESVNKERGIIEQEIRMYADNAGLGGALRTCSRRCTAAIRRASRSAEASRASRRSRPRRFTPAIRRFTIRET